MSDDLNEMMQSDLLTPPDDFSSRVMLRIAELPMPGLPTCANLATERMQWAALIGASLVGAMQLLTFIFGIWTATAAG